MTSRHRTLSPSTLSSAQNRGRLVMSIDHFEAWLSFFTAQAVPQRHYGFPVLLDLAQCWDLVRIHLRIIPHHIITTLFDLPYVIGRSSAIAGFRLF